MANDVNGIGRSAGSPRTTATPGATDDRAAAPSAGSTRTQSADGADRVSLTDGAEALRQAEGLARDATGIDPGRVEEIRSAITEGRYRIDTARLAERLIADEKLLG